MAESDSKLAEVQAALDTHRAQTARAEATRDAARAAQARSLEELERDFKVADRKAAKELLDRLKLAEADLLQKATDKLNEAS